MIEKLSELIGSKICEDYTPTCDEYSPHTCKNCYANNCKIGELAEHLLTNNVIVPPCKVGSKVYYVTQKPLCLSVQENTVYEAEVVMITTNRLGTSLVIQIYNEYGCTELPSINEWGKTLFLTREEAEQALQRKDEGK